MDYTLGKTYTLPNKFTALNGCIQYFKVEFDNVSLTSDKEITDASSEDDKAEVAAAQANLLRALELLRTLGGQPVITNVANKVLEFTLEQANAIGKSGPIQVSAHDLIEDAKTAITNLFKEVKAVDGATAFTVKSVDVKAVI